MSNCSNCYNGCTEIVSDRCVKYTGIDVPVLGIQTGDSLSFVEQALITFLTSTLDGTGIKIDLIGIDVCALVQKYLPTCGDLSIVDISKALIEAACDLQKQIDGIVADIVALNSPYTIECLTGVTTSSDTHAIVQAVINKVCALEVDLIALSLELHNQYVPINSSPGHPGVNDYIAAYLAGVSGSSKYYNRMIPYAVVEYYGPIGGNFDGNGIGLPAGPWENIYLCNGQNGTPDKRGRVGVGTTDGSMLGLTLPLDTNPGASPFNPLYTLGGSAGTSNQTSLSKLQIPAHTHLNTVQSVVNEDPHEHGLPGAGSGQGGPSAYNNGVLEALQSFPAKTNLTVTTTIDNVSEGGNQAHSNVQVGLGCYYIQYRP